MRVFETKARNNKTVYAQVMQGNRSPRYTEVKYRNIATEGYKRNWIIFRCMQEIIKGAIQLKFKVTKLNLKGEKEEIPGHQALQVLEKPNPLYSRSELIKRAIAFKYIEGNAPFHRIKAGGRVKELYVYRPDRVCYESTGNVDRPYYDIKYTNGRQVNIDPEDFMLWKEFNPCDEWDGLGRGMSLLEPVLKNGDLLNELVNWNISLLQNGGNLSGVLIMPESAGDTAFDRTEEALKSKHQGVENVGKYMLLQGVTNYISTGTNPKDMDWSQGKKDTMLDICVGMGVDPIIIGFNEQSSYNNKSEAEKGLYTKTVIPLMQDLAESLGDFLGLQENEYLEIDYSHIPCLQEDMKEMAEVLAKARDLTINEKRAKRGMEPVEGGDIIAPEGSFAIIDGKVYLPMNLIEVGEQDHTSKEGKSMDFMY